jgi:hypothetical protein
MAPSGRSVLQNRRFLYRGARWSGVCNNQYARTGREPFSSDWFYDTHYAQHECASHGHKFHDNTDISGSRGSPEHGREGQSW